MSDRPATEQEVHDHLAGYTSGGIETEAGLLIPGHEQAARSLSFRERSVLDAARRAVNQGKEPAEAYDIARHAYEAAASILGDTIKGEFWDYLKDQLGIDPQFSCCPICGGVTPPAKHLHCLSQLGEWPEKGTHYNDDV